MEQEQTPLPFTTHEAWGHMREVLEREMPEKKRRRRFIFWLLPLATAGIFLLWQNGQHSNTTANQSGSLSNKSIPTAKNSGDAPALATENTGTVPATAALPSANSDEKMAVLKQKNITVQKKKPPSAAGNRRSATITPPHLQQQYAQRVTVNKAPVFKQPAHTEPVTAEEKILMTNDSTGETESVTAPAPRNDDYSLTVPNPLLLSVTDAPGLAVLSMPPAESHLPVTATATAVKQGTRPSPFYYGIRSGLVVSHAGWIRNKRALFPQRLTPLELFVEKPLGKKLSAELSINLFSSRNIQYALHQRDSGTDAAGRYHLQNSGHTAQALHYTDVQLLLHFDLRKSWRLHGGIYFSLLKNIAVEVNRYDSSARPATGGYSFISTTETGYTYARKLNGVDLVSPFRKTDAGLLAGISYQKKQWQAGLTAQAGLPLLYNAAANAATQGTRRTLQLKLWLGLRLKR
jgi:hypothetical protein